jgi:hypothetical protein
MQCAHLGRENTHRVRNTKERMGLATPDLRWQWTRRDNKGAMAQQHLRQRLRVNDKRNQCTKLGRFIPFGRRPLGSVHPTVNSSNATQCN